MSNPAQNDLLQDEIVDDFEQDTTVAPETYAISSFGVDFDVEGLVRRLRKEEIFVPHFQRDYVWKLREASQFIESLLLGLPVPGVFLAKERSSQRLLIIDGQQRLKTLQFFYDGIFRPTLGETKSTTFQLTGVQEQFKEFTYKILTEDDRLRLDNAVIHATVIKQDAPAEEEDTSLFYIFGRLNSGGRKLTAQEIRTALYHGPLDDLLEELNGVPAWRQIFGRVNERLKDQELILRFLALFYHSDKYTRPMENFLSRFCAKYQNASEGLLSEFRETFTTMINVVHSTVGPRAFRPVRAVNAAVFDAVSVAIAKRLAKGEIKDLEKFSEAYAELSRNAEFEEVTSKSTADEKNVERRLLLAKAAFESIP